MRCSYLKFAENSDGDKAEDSSGPTTRMLIAQDSVQCSIHALPVLLVSLRASLNPVLE